LRFASREEAIFGQPEVGAGIVPGGGAIERLPALVEVWTELHCGVSDSGPAGAGARPGEGVQEDFLGFDEVGRGG
jgi:hypothetical protein